MPTSRCASTGNIMADWSRTWEEWEDGMDMMDWDHPGNATYGYDAARAPSPVPQFNDLDAAVALMDGSLLEKPLFTGWIRNDAFYRQKRNRRIVRIQNGESDKDSEDSADGEDEDSEDEDGHAKVGNRDADTDKFQAGWDLIVKGIEQAKRKGETKYLYIEDKMEGLSKELHDFQREGAGQLENLEKECKGWLLSDSMGLGKTIQAIALILQAKNKGDVGCTLIVMSKALIKQWGKELSRAKGLSVFNHEKKQAVPVDFAQYDVVLTTWGLLTAEFSRLIKAKELWDQALLGNRTTINKKGVRVSTGEERISAPFYGYRFKRIILDEAHRIRTKTSLVFAAVSTIEAEYHGCITGTPMQNDYSDLFSLISFLDIKPYNCETFFERCFITKRKGNAKAAKKLDRRLELCMASICRAISVRRNGDSVYLGRRIICAGAATQIVPYEVVLDDKAQKLQDEFKHVWDVNVRPQREKDKRYAQPGVAKNPPITFRELVRMRLSCCHPKLIDARYGAGVDGQEEDDEAQAAGVKADAARKEMDEADENKVGSVKKLDSSRRKEFIEEMSIDGVYRSSKVDAAITLIEKSLADHQKLVDAIPPGRKRREKMSRGKVILFSPSLSACDMIAIGLKKKGIKHYEYDGHIPDKERTKILHQFEELDINEEPRGFGHESQEPDEVRVILATIQVAGEGLNLVHASNIIFLADVWNPFAMDQAMSRAIRFGQLEEVTVFFIRALNSIELRIYEICEEKRAKVNGISGEATIDQDIEILDGLNLESFVSMVTIPYPTHSNPLTSITGQ